MKMSQKAQTRLICISICVALGAGTTAWAAAPDSTDSSATYVARHTHGVTQVDSTALRVSAQ